MDHTLFIVLKFIMLIVGALILATPFIYLLHWENSSNSMAVFIGIVILSFGLSIQKR
jgi:hypothetical protein